MCESFQGITVVASFYLKKDYLDEVLPVVATCIKASRQEATNFSYICRRDLNDPLHFVFIEQWQSAAAIHEHEQQPHFLAMKSALEKGMEGPLVVTMLENVTAFS
ncbi:putative quinol monooxygenase [Gluconobacter morbifer]|uniref:Putative antibiotic biosynthesis monooxygenase n=1 Tax=Gluconobacter morbifer G707 TaxID=1088869 RepID=G6XHA0_9PROT|nr:putative quinol monooxygenase [Gluconobacter morbifer]EHH69558.1 putative antibiotic biosynthesis monooxygenase [Gluconobacter morbifer G707]